MAATLVPFSKRRRHARARPPNDVEIACRQLEKLSRNQQQWVGKLIALLHAGVFRVNVGHPAHNIGKPVITIDRDSGKEGA